jgi:hypothetical protein
VHVMRNCDSSKIQSYEHLYTIPQRLFYIYGWISLIFLIQHYQYIICRTKILGKRNKCRLYYICLELLINFLQSSASEC